MGRRAVRGKRRRRARAAERREGGAKAARAILVPRKSSILSICAGRFNFSCS